MQGTAFANIDGIATTQRAALVQAGQPDGFFYTLGTGFWPFRVADLSDSGMTSGLQPAEGASTP